MLSTDAALVLGRWQLRTKDEPRGAYAAVQKNKGRLENVHDHTSSA